MNDTNARRLTRRAIAFAYGYKPDVVAAGIMLAHGITPEQAHAILCKKPKPGLFVCVGEDIMCSVYNAYNAAKKGILTPNMTERG